MFGLDRNSSTKKSQLPTAAEARFSAGTDLQLCECFFIRFADRLTLHRIEIFIDRFNEFQLFKVCQVQKSVENDCQIFVHSSKYIGGPIAVALARSVKSSF